MHRETASGAYALCAPIPGGILITPGQTRDTHIMPSNRDKPIIILMFTSLHCRLF